MNYTKTIICLANSRKLSGRCIAGKEKTAEGVYEWVRPVSGRLTGEVSEYERMYPNGDDPKILDLIEIPMLHPRPHHYQTENHVIDEKCSWNKVGQFKKNQLHLLADTIDGSVWVTWSLKS